MPQFPCSGLNQAKTEHADLFREIVGSVRQTCRRAYLCFSHWRWTTWCFTWRGQEVTELHALTLSVTHKHIHALGTTVIKQMAYYAKTKQKKKECKPHVPLVEKHSAICHFIFRIFKGKQQENCQTELNQLNMQLYLREQVFIYLLGSLSFDIWNTYMHSKNVRNTLNEKWIALM